MSSPPRTEVQICKKVMSPKGRALRAAATCRPVTTVRFRIRVTNLGTEVGRNVRVCDLLPRGTDARSARRSSPSIPQRPPVPAIPRLTVSVEGFVTTAGHAHRERPDPTNTAEATSADGGPDREHREVPPAPGPCAPGGGVTR